MNAGQENSFHVKSSGNKNIGEERKKMHDSSKAISLKIGKEDPEHKSKRLQEE